MKSYQGSSVRHPCWPEPYAHWLSTHHGLFFLAILFRTHCLAVLLGYSSSFTNHQPQRFFWLSEKPAGKTLQYPAALEARTLGFLWFLSYSCSKTGPSSMQVWFWVLYQASCFGALADMQLMGKFWERLWVKQICFFVQIQSVVNQSKLISWKMLEDLYNHAGVDPKLALGIFWFRILEAQPVSLTEIITQIVIEIACSEQSRTHEVANGYLPQWNLF